MLLIGLRIAYNQQFFKLTIIQPPLLSIILPDSLFVNDQEEINLDTIFQVEGGLSFASVWKFDDGLQLHTIENPLLKATINNTGTYYLSIIDENNCTSVDSVFIQIESGTGYIYSERNHSQSINIYNYNNTGEFEILIHECLPGYTLHILNPVGIQLLNIELNCNNHEYRKKIKLPKAYSGVYILLIMNNKELVYSHKMIILN